MVIFGHRIGGTEEVPKISFDVVGSTGNIYKVIVARVPRCDCPSYRMRKVPCKHMGFGEFHVISSCNAHYNPSELTIISRYATLTGSQVLKEAMVAPEKLVYQQALLPSVSTCRPHLSATLFRLSAYPIFQELREMLDKSPLNRIIDSTTSVPTDERRSIAGECLICSKEVDPSQVIMWCRVCGNNFHQHCVEKRKARENKRDVFRCAEW